MWHYPQLPSRPEEGLPFVETQKPRPRPAVTEVIRETGTVHWQRYTKCRDEKRGGRERSKARVGVQGTKESWESLRGDCCTTSGGQNTGLQSEALLASGQQVFHDTPASTAEQLFLAAS